MIVKYKNIHKYKKYIIKPNSDLSLSQAEKVQFNEKLGEAIVRSDNTCLHKDIDMDLTYLLMGLLCIACVVLIFLLLEFSQDFAHLKQELLYFALMLLALLSSSGTESIFKSFLGCIMLFKRSKFSTDFKHQVTVFNLQSY